MRLSGIRSVGGKRGNFAPADESAPASHAEPSRALVTRTPAKTHEPPSRYLQAPFLAQLLAVRNDHPQMRERRRGEPSEARAAYSAATNLVR
jgi:hypothetical protein